MPTIKQAKAQWCPMVRHTNKDIGSFNRGTADSNPANKDGPDTRDDHQGKYGCHCIADQCAAWRWGTINISPPDAEPGKLVDGVKKCANWGYCGLAGKPEWSA